MKHIRFWTTCAILYAIAIFIGSAIPGPNLPEAVQEVSDKILHGTEYGIFGFIVYRALAGQRRWPAIARHAVVGACIAVCLYGASDEVHQWFVPGRIADVLDWLADTAGGAAGVAVSWWWLKRSQFRHGSASVHQGRV